MKQSIDKTMVTRALIAKIENENEGVEIKAKHVLGYESPDEINLHEDDLNYTPDIAVIYEKSMTIYEIELTEKMTTNKWQMLSRYARNQNGNLYLIVPDYLKEPIKQKITEHEISAGVIVFQTMQQQ